MATNFNALFFAGALVAARTVGLMDHELFWYEVTQALSRRDEHRNMVAYWRGLARSRAIES